jgi:hypothetical protein
MYLPTPLGLPSTLCTYLPLSGYLLLYVPTYPSRATFYSMYLPRSELWGIEPQVRGYEPVPSPLYNSR